MCNIYYLQGHFLEAEFPLLAVSISPNCCRADWGLHQHQQGALGCCRHAQVKLQCSACMCQGHCRLLWLCCCSRERHSSGASENRRAVPQSPPVHPSACRPVLRLRHAQQITAVQITALPAALGSRLQRSACCFAQGLLLSLAPAGTGSKESPFCRGSALCALYYLLTVQ